jgi:hypothetical protein
MIVACSGNNQEKSGEPIEIFLKIGDFTDYKGELSLYFVCYFLITKKAVPEKGHSFLLHSLSLAGLFGFRQTKDCQGVRFKGIAACRGQAVDILTGGSNRRFVERILGVQIARQNGLVTLGFHGGALHI